MINFCNYKWTNAMEGGRQIDKNRPWMRFDKEAAWIDEMGNVNLGIHTSPKDVTYKGKTYHTMFAVGVMRSVETFSHGRFSADIMMPKGNFLWPSFWLVGDGHWPDNGEIDIMEAWTNGAGSYYRFPLGWRTTTNVHYLGDEMLHKEVGSKNVCILTQPRNPSEQFINYSCEWRPDKITFYANGVRTRTVGTDIAKRLAYKNANVIFDIWTDREDFTLDMPMVVRNFKFEEL